MRLNSNVERVVCSRFSSFSLYLFLLSPFSVPFNPRSTTSRKACPCFYIYSQQALGLLPEVRSSLYNRCSLFIPFDSFAHAYFFKFLFSPIFSFNCYSFSIPTPRRRRGTPPETISSGFTRVCKSRRSRSLDATTLEG